MHKLEEVKARKMHLNNQKRHTAFLSIWEKISFIKISARTIHFP